MPGYTASSWSLLALTAGATVGALVLLRRYMQGAKFISNVSAVGKIVIVTGANTGIGKETARELARRGATVYMACRDIEKAQTACDEIIAETTNKHVSVLKLDLSSLKSVEEFAHNFKKLHNQLHILINNAAVLGTKRDEKTKDGFEMHFGVNHLGHFYLTNLLLDNLKAAAPSRIVVVSSIVHNRGIIHKEDLNNERNFSKFGLYQNSKLANILFTRELAKRLHGTGVTVNAVHPGAVRTDIGRNHPIAAAIIGFIFYFFIKNVKNGAQTTLYAALDPDLDHTTGMYFSDCKPTRMAPAAMDDETAAWLWEESQRLIILKTE